MNDTQHRNQEPQRHREPPRFIAVEGPIGVGKTSLAQRLAESFGCELLLEQPDENPFLDRFYQDPRRHALPVQLSFLLHRVRQLQELRQDDIFQQVLVTDFLIDKDELFAQVNLDKDEYDLYLNVYRHLTIDAPTPGLVIYLQAPTEVLLTRIQKRGVPSERFIEPGYLEKLNRAYTEFFHYYRKSRLLIVNSTDINPVENEDDYKQLLNYILTLPSGTHYFNPRPALL